MILTHRDVFSELSARSLIRSDAGHRKGRATRSERSEKTQALSPLGRVGGRQQALEMTHIARGLLPTRRGPGAIPLGHYRQDLVLAHPRRDLLDRRLAARPGQSEADFGLSKAAKSSDGEITGLGEIHFRAAPRVVDMSGDQAGSFGAASVGKPDQSF